MRLTPLHAPSPPDTGERAGERGLHPYNKAHRALLALSPNPSPASGRGEPTRLTPLHATSPPDTGERAGERGLRPYNQPHRAWPDTSDREGT